MSVAIRRWVMCCAAFAAVTPAWGKELKDAQAALKEKNYARAVELLDQHLQQHPQSLPGYLLRGQALVERGDYKRAIEDLDRVLAKDDNHALAHCFRGRAHLRQLMSNPNKAFADFDKALADFDKALEVDPKLADGYFHRGFARMAKHHVGFEQSTFDDALLPNAFQDFHQAIALDDQQYAYYIGRGLSQIAMGMPTRRFQFTVVIEGQPERREGRRTDIEDREKARDGIADFGRAIDLDVQNPEGYFHRLEANHKLGNLKPYLADLKVFCKLVPKHPDKLNELAWHLATLPNADQRNGLEAVAAAERACELTDHKRPEFLGTLAAAYAEAGKFKKAVDAQRQAIALLKGTEWAQHKPEFEARLKLYQNKQPYHQPLPKEPTPAATPNP